MVVILHPNPITFISLTEAQDMLYISGTPTPLGGGKRSLTNCIWKIEVPMENENTLRRLKTVEGHLRGVIRMVEEDAYCIDVIRQIQAVEAALNKVSARILEDHLNSCVITAIQGNDKKERERVLKEITEVFEMSTKV
jgi:CsoR family transcriptional regulator, copper-sensing transcriptional repressor